MKIGILDDEKNAAETLQAYVKKYAAEHGPACVTEVFLLAEKLLDSYENDYDILFLDIEMPAINGLEAAKRIRERDENVVIVFITNMAQYAINGYEVHAADYVLKPLSYPDFALKMAKAVRFAALSRKKYDKPVPINTTEGLVNLKISQICYIEVRKNYLYYHTDETEFKARGTMKIAEAELAGYDFYRISNCYLINMARITKVGGGVLTVAAQELPISRHKKADFMKTFIAYSGRL